MGGGIVGMARRALLALALLHCYLSGPVDARGSHNEEYPTCRHEEYPCFVQEGHSALYNNDYTKAAEWFTKAANAGYGPGLDGMGFLHQMGLGVQRNTDRAFELYQLAADAEDEQGMFHVGACYSKGIGVKADQKKALHWWTKAVESGQHASSAYNLALRYEAGSGVTKDPRRAVEYFSIAAHQGHLGAMYNLGVFTTYTPGPRQNKTEGCNWFLNVTVGGEHGQNKNDPVIARAMTNLALCYLTGRGMEHDVDEGRQWLELAATKKGDGAERAKSLLAQGLEAFKDFQKPSYKDDLEFSKTKGENAEKNEL